MSLEDWSQVEIIKIIHYTVNEDPCWTIDDTSDVILEFMFAIVNRRFEIEKCFHKIHSSFFTDE